MICDRARDRLAKSQISPKTQLSDYCHQNLQPFVVLSFIGLLFVTCRLEQNAMRSMWTLIGQLIVQPTYVGNT